MENLKTIEGVEIFSAGIWNGDEYTEQCLDDIVHAFNKTSTRIRPALKLGHTKDQTLIRCKSERSQCGQTARRTYR